MAAKWVEAITGSLEQKKQYRQYRARLEAPIEEMTKAERSGAEGATRIEGEF